MLTHCFFCSRVFPGQDELEHLRIGKRVIYDPRRGRLWVECEACRSWSLTPIEARWEALEELEERTSNGRLLARTEHMALFALDKVEVLRIGNAPFREEAWWRYGRKLLRRRAHHRRGVLPSALLKGAATLGALLTHWYDPVLVWQALSPEAKFGELAWSGAAACAVCGGVLRKLPYREWARLVLVPGASGELSVWVECRRCGKKPEAGYRLDDTDAEGLLRRVLAYRHQKGAPLREVERAAAAIQETGSAEAFTRGLATKRMSLRELDSTRSLALEMAVNDVVEQREITSDLRALEVRWRRKEEVAGIADSELTPDPRRRGSTP